MSFKAVEKTYRPKLCKCCKQTFTPDRPLQGTCTWVCAVEYAKQQHEAKRVKEAKKAKQEYKANDLALLKRKAQAIVNEYVRLRDKDEPCISCGYSGADRIWHGGHYIPMGSSSALRFDERNIHKQDSQCNLFKSGNLAEYRKGLIDKIGLETVEELEAKRNDTKKWTIEELKEIIDIYKAKTKELQC